MVEGLLRKLFGSRTPTPCLGCIALDKAIEAQKETIQELKNEVQYLRDERRELQTLFNRSLRLEPEVQRVKETHQAAGVIGSSRNWNKLKVELEKKYSKPSDPDKTQEYWKNKAKQMAHDAGLEPASTEERVDR